MAKTIQKPKTSKTTKKQAEAPTAVTKAKRGPKPATPEISERKARELDQRINDRMRATYDQAIRSYLEIAADLHEMKTTRGYMTLGFDNWEAYKASKDEFGRTYISYLIRLGEAGDLASYIDDGSAASLFIEYAKVARSGDQIPKLLEATWDEVKKLPIRAARETLRDYVAAHAAEFELEKKGKGGRKPETYDQKIEKQFTKVPDNEKKAFLDALRAFLKRQDEENEAWMEALSDEKQ